MDFPNKAARLDYLLKEEIEGGGEITVSWTSVTDKPTTFASTWATVSGKPTTFPSTWATVSGKPTTFAPVVATTTVTGGVKQAAAVADVAAAPTMEEFNALLAALRTAGIMVA